MGTATTQAQVGLAVAALDPTTLGDDAERVISGLRQDTVTWAGLFDDGTSMDAAANALVGSGTNNVISVLIGTALGSRAYSGTVVQLTHQTPMAIAELVRMESEFKPDQAWDVCQSFGQATSFGSGETGSGTIDIATSDIASGNTTAFLHLFSIDSGTVNPVLQHHATGAGSWEDLIDFGSFTSGLTSTLGTFTGSIGGVFRVVNNATGTGTFAVTFTPP